MFTVYIIYSSSLLSYYIGYCKEDFELRLEKHRLGFYDDSYTKKANDWELFLLINCTSSTQALKIENHIKRMKSKIYIKNLLLYSEIVEKLLSKYELKG